MTCMDVEKVLPAVPLPPSRRKFSGTASKEGAPQASREKELRRCHLTNADRFLINGLVLLHLSNLSDNFTEYSYFVTP